MDKFESEMKVFASNQGVSATVSTVKDSVVIELISKPNVSDSLTKKGDLVEINYTAKLADGKIFESSYDLQQPAKFEIGAGQVIRGWEEEVLDMCLGR